MWTHLQPHLKSQLTQASILKRARVEVFRSLNLRRLIAFTGSGATSSFGLPDWDDLARMFVEATLAEVDAFRPAGKVSLPPAVLATEPLLSQLARLLGRPCGFDMAQGGRLDAQVRNAHFPDDKTLVMDLCEEILRLLPDDPQDGRSRIFKVREAFAQHFRKSASGLAERKWRGLLEGTEIELPSKGEYAIDSAQIRAALADIGREERGALETSPDLHLGCVLYCLNGSEATTQQRRATAVSAWLQLTADQGEPEGWPDKPMEPHMGPFDPCGGAGAHDLSDVLTRHLNVARIATLNYDVQLERAVLRQTGNLPGVDTDGFADLCKDWQTRRPHTKRLMMENLLQRGAVSITLGQENVGDIVNFAAYSRQYGHQILHLHGRFDDAANLVLTKRDYDRLYMSRAAPRMIFREAQEMLFGGNDVLILGIGMSEDDVVRPFRRLMAREDHEAGNTRRVFLLKGRSYCVDCEDDGTCAACDARDEVEVLNNMVRYQIHTLLFGGKAWRATMSRFRNAEKALEKDPVDKALLGLCAFLDNAAASSFEDKPEEKLLLQWEVRLLTKAAAAGRGDFARSAARAVVKELKGRVMSRALVRELKQLDKEKGDWWDAWRRSPFERRAIYHQYVPDDASAGRGPNYLWLRHCPANVPTLEAPDQWVQLREARQYAFEANATGRLNRVRGDEPNSRVLRLTAPRGSGKGSLIRLLMDQKAQQHIFPPDKRGQTGYEAAFMAHQSFSMEFSSVTKALTRFFARQAAELMLKRMCFASDRAESKNLRETLDRIDKEELAPGAGHRLTGTLILRELAPADLRILGIIENGSALIDQLKSDRSIESELFRKAIAERLYVVRREEEPRLVPEPHLTSATQLPPEVVRRHRLDVLRRTMEVLETVCEKRTERFFVCLSGLDRICDSKGDARNPMHRALFRMLCGTTDPELRDPDPPVDYLFLAGAPETPIAFLSEEFEGGEGQTEPATEHRKYYSQETRTGRFLLKWPELSPPDWRERLRLSRSDDREDEEANRECDTVFLNWAQRTLPDRFDNRFDEMHSTREIRRALWHNVALSLIVLRGWARVAHAQCETDPAAPQVRRFRNYIEPLDRAYARDGSQGVLARVLAEHERIDRTETDKKLDDDGIVTLDPLLIRLILRHLVLFRLPVEIWVLMGCPLIYRHLRDGFDRFCAGLDDDQPARDTSVDQFRERAFILDNLSYHLKELCRRCLVIEIEPSQNSEDGTAGREDHERRLHMRYALHARLREHFAFHMQLQISDEGDLNHHQMSVFCDQPRDLPTPRPAHFRMIEEIVGHMIERSRIMLDATYRTTWSGRQYKRKPWDVRPGSDDGTADKAALRRAAEHIFFPAEDDVQPLLRAAGIAGSMGQIHAVPQRLRACFSMLQTALTVGSLTRLDTVYLKPGDEAPFEVYRGWLRGLLNAAVGLERNRKELGMLLDGSVFKADAATDQPDDFAKRELQPLDAQIKEWKDPERKDELEKLFDEVCTGMKEVRDLANEKHLPVRQRTKYNALRHPFYRDEVAWLYNERGLVSFMQGRLFDAIPLFKQARFIMEHAKTPPFDSKAYNAAERRINLNLALAYIERGKIDVARRMLRELEVSLRSVERSTPSKVHGFARGYLAFCDHLSGSFEGALSEYRDCLKDFIERRDLRAISIFNRMMGDLNIRIGRREQARTCLEMALHSASQAEQRDVENHALLSLAVFEIATGTPNVAQGRIGRVLHYATQMGLYRLEAEAHLAEGKLNLQRGELGLAAEAVARAVAMSARHGLRLIKLGGLVTYGKIQFARGEYALASSVLEEAKRESETLGFQLEASEAADILAQISPLLSDGDRAAAAGTV